MIYLNIIAISLALSMDALAVSITNGLVIKNLKKRYAFRMAFFFGFFQGIMPLIGWITGQSFAKYIKDYDHWIAFILLSAIGGKMIWEARKIEDCNFKKKNCLHLPTLFILSIATSIDALAVGVSFSVLDQPLLTSILFIGIITFIVCLIGAYIGNKFGHFLEDKIEIIGGIILILIGIKILVEHLINHI